MYRQSKGSHQVHLMMDVVMRQNKGKEKEELLLLPGQAFQIPHNLGMFARSWDLELWVFSALFSKDKIYVDVNSTPMSESELRSEGLIDVAKTSKGFGLTVLTFNEQPMGLFYDYFPGCKSKGRWHDSVPVTKFFEMEQSAMLINTVRTPFVPKIFVKVKSDVKLQPTDKVMWGVREEKPIVVRPVPIPIVLGNPEHSSYMTSSEDNGLWKYEADKWWASSYRAVHAYVKAHAELEEKFYVSWGDETDAYYNVRADRKAYNDIKMFVCKTNRMLSVGNYRSGDPFGFIDTGRKDVNTLQEATTRVLDRKSDYIGSL